MTIAATISPRQIKAIHALVGRLGWDDDIYRAMLRARYQVTTCKALSHARAVLLIDELKVKAGQRPAGPPPISPARPVTARRAHRWPDRTAVSGQRSAVSGGMITPGQQEYINLLFSKLGWDQRRRDGFCRKVLGKPWPQSNAEVTHLLNLLRAMGRRYPGGYDRAQGGRQ